MTAAGARRAAALGAAALVASLVALACDDTERSHIFAGRLFEDARGCLDPVSSMDVVDGPVPTSPCDPKCFVSPPSDDGGLLVYVSTMCAPFPPAFGATGTDPRCAPALAAYGANTTCLADGGIGVPSN